jgi:hypothetical protein
MLVMRHTDAFSEIKLPAFSAPESDRFICGHGCQASRGAPHPQSTWDLAQPPDVGAVSMQPATLYSEAEVPEYDPSVVRCHTR